MAASATSGLVPGRASAQPPARASAGSAGVELPRLSSSTAPPPPPLVADYYVCHSPLDSAAAKQRALARWLFARAEALGAAHGGEVAESAQPTAWLDVACADERLAPAEQLALMPCYLAQSRRLLLLAGPSLADDLRCCIELYAWRAMGGLLAEVDVVPVVEDEAGARRLEASFDAFHVMWAKGLREDEVSRMVHSVELATVARFNETIREHLAPVARATARLCAEWADDAGTAAAAAREGPAHGTHHA